MIISIVLGTVFCLVSGFWLIAENVIPLWGQWVLALVMWTLWLASGCLAATAAELLKLRVFPHAVLGLCLPYIYPLWMISRFRKNTARQEEIRQQQEAEEKEEGKAALASRFLAMQEKRDQERRERIAERQGISVDEVIAREEARNAAKEEAGQAELPAAEEPIPAETIPDNEIYQILYPLPVDDNGVRRGPFQITFNGGDTIDIDGIRELHPDFMICTICETGKSVRIKYTQVESVARYTSG